MLVVAHCSERDLRQDVVVLGSGERGVQQHHVVLWVEEDRQFRQSRGHVAAMHGTSHFLKNSPEPVHPPLVTNSLNCKRHRSLVALGLHLLGSVRATGLLYEHIGPG